MRNASVAGHPHSLVAIDRVTGTFSKLIMALLNGTDSLKFARLTDKAYAPIRGSKYAAGYDLKRYVSCSIFFFANRR